MVTAGSPLVALIATETMVATCGEKDSTNIYLGQILNLNNPREPIGPLIEDGSCAELNITQPVADPSVGSLDLHDDSLTSMDIFRDPSKPPLKFNLPPNFNWVYIHGVWTLAPGEVSKDLHTWSSIEEDNTHSDQM